MTIYVVRKIKEGQNARKASDPDGVSNWIVRECNQQLADKIRSVIMNSLAEGKVPIDWKRADIVPIFKGGNKEDRLNYRPMSLTNIVAIICKWLIEDSG